MKKSTQRLNRITRKLHDYINGKCNLTEKQIKLLIARQQMLFYAGKQYGV